MRAPKMLAGGSNQHASRRFGKSLAKTQLGRSRRLGQGPPPEVPWPIGYDERSSLPFVEVSLGKAHPVVSFPRSGSGGRVRHAAQGHLSSLISTTQASTPT